MNEPNATHLNAEQLNKLNKIQMISPEKFNFCFSAYSDGSDYRKGKEFLNSYSPRFFSSYVFVPSPTDFLISNIRDVSGQNDISDKKKAIVISRLLKQYILDRNNSSHGFCKYLVNNLSGLASASAVLELAFTERNVSPGVAA